MMIENSITPEDTTVPSKQQRYAPPNQRNRPLNRRKSGGSSAMKTLLEPEPEPEPPTTITMKGCSRSEAAHLLSHRWLTAIHSSNDPSVHLSERPVMYSGAGASAWGQLKLSHQMDFLTELRRAMTDAGYC